MTHMQYRKINVAFNTLLHAASASQHLGLTVSEMRMNDLASNLLVKVLQVLNIARSYSIILIDPVPSVSSGLSSQLLQNSTIKCPNTYDHIMRLDCLPEAQAYAIELHCNDTNILVDCHNCFVYPMGHA